MSVAGRGVWTALVAVVSAVGLLAGAGTGLAEEAKFTETGKEHEFIVPAGVTSVHVAVDGGAGATNGSGHLGGPGAQVTSDVNVTPGSTLFVEVGIRGGAGGSRGAGEGGGASDVRTCSITDSTCPAVGTAGDPRLVVAGGGGGAGAGGGGGRGGAAGTGMLLPCNPGMNGEAGITGVPGAGGLGGGCTSGGTGGPGAVGGEAGGEGTASSGGAGANHENGGGGGGAGYFGGGGGGSNGSAPGSGGGGGGGSSFGPTGSLFKTATTGPSVTFTFTLAVPTNKEQCKKGGWRELTDSNGKPFKNQGQCVRFVRHHH